MALAQIAAWARETAATGTVASCGAGDAPEETPAACGTACGAGDAPEEAPAACGTACGAGDK